jgi:hypothetical protein
MRRRLERQRRVREALLLDLGALVYELHRQGRRAPELLQAKAAELSDVDGEVRALEDALGRGAGTDELIAAGILGSCAVCGGLLNVGDRFCSGCGSPVEQGGEAPAAEGWPEAEEEAGDAPEEAPGEAPASEDAEPDPAADDEPAGTR